MNLINRNINKSMKRYNATFSLKNVNNTKPIYELYTDGGSRGNPGISGSGAVLYRITNDIKEEIDTREEYIGISTNNVAEYNSLLIGLEMCKKNCIKDVTIKMDSMLVVNQITGKWKVKDTKMKDYNSKCIDVLKYFDNYNISHVLRKNNKRADELVNNILDHVVSK